MNTNNDSEKDLLPVATGDEPGRRLQDTGLDIKKRSLEKSAGLTKFL